MLGFYKKNSRGFGGDAITVKSKMAAGGQICRGPEPFSDMHN